METKQTQGQAGQPTKAAQSPSNVRLAIVNLGDIIFHNSWFHSAGVRPDSAAEGMLILKINLVSPGGMGEGFEMHGSMQEISQAYTSLMQQVGTVPMETLKPDTPIGQAEQMDKPVPPEGNRKGIHLVKPSKGDKDDKQDGPTSEA